jgi:hypothetical protein
MVKIRVLEEISALVTVAKNGTKRRVLNRNLNFKFE